MKKRKRRTRPAWDDWQTGTDHPLLVGTPGYIGTFVNALYQVEMKEFPSAWGPMIWLSIVNRDRSHRHDWRELQRIKNELVGPEREAIELYPAESRLVDTNNQFHLFVFPEGVTVPLGYCERDVSDRVEGAHKQRAFEQKPEGLNARPLNHRTIGIFVTTEDDTDTDTET